MVTSKLKSAAAPSRWADNKVALARALGVSRQTLDRWSKLPGAPKPASNGRHDVEAWARWVREDRARETPPAEGAEPTAAGAAGERAELEKRRLRAICERLEFELAKVRGEYVEREKVFQDGLRLGHALRAEHLRLIADLPPLLAGLNEWEIETKVGDAIDRLMASMHDDNNPFYHAYVRSDGKLVASSAEKKPATSEGE